MAGKGVQLNLYIQQAIYNAANKSSHKNRHGACLLNKGASHILPKSISYNDVQHAEVRSLCRSSLSNTEQKRGIVLVVARVSPHLPLSFKNSKPCRACLQHIRRIKTVTHIIYSTDDNTFIKVAVSEMETFHITYGQRQKLIT